MHFKRMLAILFIAGATVLLISRPVRPQISMAAHRTGAAPKKGKAPADHRLGQTSGSISDSAYPELTSAVEANQNSFFVYLDEDSGLNHGFPSGDFTGYGAPQVTIDPGCIDDPADTNIGCYPASDTTVLDLQHGTILRVTFPPETGMQFTGLNIEEPQNWGALNAGGQCGVTTTCNPYDLTGAANVEFDVRSPDGITLQFGVGSDPPGGCATQFMTFPASTTYTHVSLTLGPPSLACTPNLTDVNVLFFVVTNATSAPNGGTILLDNIQFTPVPARANQDGQTFSLPTSTKTYGVVPQTSNFPPDQVNRNIATIYESALTLLSLLHRGQPGDLTDADELANALDYALYHDNHGDYIPTSPMASAGCFGGIAATQCGLHNAYDDGDVGLLNNQLAPAAGLAGDTRLAGFTVPTTQPGFDLVLDGATGGNNAFAAIALLAAYKQFNNAAYLNDAIAIANWIVGLTDSSGTGYGGYFLGYPDMGIIPKQLIISKSTENNADIFAAFTLLAEIETGLNSPPTAAQWAVNAAVAGNFVLAMYDSVNGRFNTGTVPTGTPPGPGVCPTGAQKGNDVINVCDFLDADSFTSLALAGSAPYGTFTPTKADWQAAMQYVLNLTGANTFTQAVTANNLPFSGFDLVPAPPATGISWEFTGQSVETCNYLDAILGGTTFNTCAQTYIAQIGQAQTSAPFADGSSLVAATLDGENNPPNNLPPVSECLPTPFQCIPERLGLAATNWAIYADSEINPLAFFSQPVFSASGLTFPAQFIGSSSNPANLTLANTGSMVLRISDIAISGANGADFSQTNTCGASLVSGASCTISVVFTPTGTGSKTATVTITDNAPSATQTMALTGTGTGPVVTLSATSLALATEPVGTASPAMAVKLTNSGTTALTVTSIVIGGANPSDFSQTNTCGASVGAAASCSITAIFKPTASGSRTATVTITDNALPATQTVMLNGAGTDFSITVSPSSGTASASAAAAYTLTVTPVSSFNGAVALTCAGAPSGSTCSISPSSVTPNGKAVTATATVSVNSGSAADWIGGARPLLPLRSPRNSGWLLLGLLGLPALWGMGQRRVGSRAGRLWVLGAVTALVLLWVACGVGSSSTTSQAVQPSVSLSATSLTFTPENLGTTSAAQTVTLTNNGPGSLSKPTISITGADSSDFAQTNTCASRVQAGSTCKVGVTFTPGADGARSGSLMISDNAGKSPQSVMLAGTGQTTSTLTFIGAAGTLSHKTTASVTVQ